MTPVCPVNDTRPPNQDEVLRLIARAVVPHVLDELRGMQAPGPVYYDQTNSPLGRRRHLALAREGALPRRKVGRRVLVECAHVHAHIEAHAQEPVSSGDDGDNDVLREWGLRGARVIRSAPGRSRRTGGEP